jgi:hypothetical protein
MPLKYLFTAEYKDGSTYEQNAEDVSLTDEKRSSFFDIKQDELVRFTLKGDGHEYAVDLRDGGFSIDGVSFAMHEEALADFRLVFFRAHTHHYQMDRTELSHDIVYRLGWQCTVNGENYQRIMQIN